MYNKKMRKGFSLLEVLISLIIIGVGLAAVSGILIAGRHYLKRAENKARATSVVSTHMQRYLAKSFKTLLPGSETGSQDIADWQVVVEEKWEGEGCIDPTDPDKKCIPYKEITVNATYADQKITGGQIHKQIELANIVPYPYIHIEKIPEIIINDPSSVTPAPNFPTYRIIDDRLRLEGINYPVDKDVIIIYNIAIDVDTLNDDPDTGLQPADTLYTRCFVDGIEQEIETRTPIITQPLINNVVQVDHLAKNQDHIIEVQWRQQTDFNNVVRITLKRANLIVVSIESD